MGMGAQTPGDELARSVTIVNFGHPLDEGQLAQVVALVGLTVGEVIEIPAAIRQEQPLAPQAVALVESAELSPRDWQTRELLINLPGLAPLAAALLAELHGRMGHFPAILRLRPEVDGPITQYVVADVINLQTLRDAARTRRAPGSAADENAVTSGG